VPGYGDDQTFMGVFRDIIRPQQGVSNTGISKVFNILGKNTAFQLDMILGRRTFIGQNLTKSTKKYDNIPHPCVWDNQQDAVFLG